MTWCSAHAHLVDVPLRDLAGHLGDVDGPALHPALLVLALLEQPVQLDPLVLGVAQQLLHLGGARPALLVTGPLVFLVVAVHVHVHPLDHRILPPACHHFYLLFICLP